MNGISFPCGTVGADRIRPKLAQLSCPLNGIMLDAVPFNRVLSGIRGLRADTIRPDGTQWSKPEMPYHASTHMRALTDAKEITIFSSFQPHISK